MWREILQGLVVWAISSIILKAFDWLVGRPHFVETIWQKFIVELWPVWIGLSIAAVYSFITFLLGTRRMAQRSLQLTASLIERLNADANR